MGTPSLPELGGPAPAARPGAPAARIPAERVVVPVGDRAVPAPPVAPTADLAAPLLRLLRSIEGEGAVHVVGTPPVAVGYTLREVQERRRETTDRPDPADVVPGAPQIYGLLRLPASSVLGAHIGGRLTLELADGRPLPFTITKVLDRHSVLIQALGALP